MCNECILKKHVVVPDVFFGTSLSTKDVDQNTIKGSHFLKMFCYFLRDRLTKIATIKS